jgi:hypothetical protein
MVHYQVQALVYTMNIFLIVLVLLFHFRPFYASEFSNEDNSKPEYSDTSSDDLSVTSQESFEIITHSDGLRSSLKGNRTGLSPKGIRFDPILGEYVKPLPFPFTFGDEEECEVKFWDSIVSGSHDEALEIYRSGFNPINSKLAFSTMRTLVSDPNTDTNTFKLLHSLNPLLFCNSFTDSGNIYLGAHQNTIDFIIDTFPKRLTMLKLIFIAYCARQSINLPDKVFTKSKLKVTGCYCIIANRMNPRPDVLVKLYSLSPKFNVLISNGETVLTQALKDDNSFVIDLLLARSDAIDILSYKNSSHEYAINVAKRIEQSKAVFDYFDLESFPLTRKLISIINNFYSGLTSVSKEDARKIIDSFDRIKKLANGDSVILSLLRQSVDLIYFSLFEGPDYLEEPLEKFRQSLQDI